MVATALLCLCALPFLRFAAVAAQTTPQPSGGPWLPDYWNDLADDTIANAETRVPNTNVAKNLVLVIGDGMGLATCTATRILLGQQQNKLGEEEYLAWETFPHIALSKTYNTDAMTPDSAGTATAYHYGFKTKLGVIGLDDRAIRGNCSTQALASSSSSKNLLQLAELAGKSTGIVTTTRITHASPAPLYAKSAHRNWECDADLPPDAKGICKDIALQLLENGIDMEVVMGGGRGKFMPLTETDPEYSNMRGERTDGRNLINEWQQQQSSRNKNCRYVWNQDGFNRVNSSVDCVLALFEPSHMLYELDRENRRFNEPSLTEMVEKAIQILSKNPKGFYLFIEGGKIDHGHHDNLARYALTDALELHRAVGKVMDMTSNKDTLVVVTADHSHVFNIVGYSARGTPIFGLTNNVEKGSNQPTDGKPYTILIYGNGPGHANPRQNLTGVNTASKTYAFQSAVPLPSETHGGEDVVIYASGPMSHFFYGVQEQTYIPHVMAYAACIGSNAKHCPGSNTAGEQRIGRPLGAGFLVILVVLCNLLALSVTASK